MIHNPLKPRATSGGRLAEEHGGISALERELAASEKLEARIAELSDPEPNGFSPRARLLKQQREAVLRKRKVLGMQLAVRRLASAVQQCGPTAASNIDTCQRQRDQAAQEVDALQADLQKQQPRMAQLQQRMRAAAEGDQALEAAARDELAAAAVAGDEDRIERASQSLESILARQQQGGPATQSLVLQHSALAVEINRLESALQAAQSELAARAEAWAAAQREQVSLTIEGCLLGATAALIQRAQMRGAARELPQGLNPILGTSCLLRAAEPEALRVYNAELPYLRDGSLCTRADDEALLAQDPLQLSAERPDQ